MINFSLQNLVVALKELQTEVREGVVSKRAELDNLPVENGRVDLISYASSPPMQYTIIFPTQKIKTQWKTGFLQAKRTADDQAPPSANVAPPTSPLPVVLPSDYEKVEFQSHTHLPSVRTGMQVRDCWQTDFLWISQIVLIKRCDLNRGFTHFRGPAKFRGLDLAAKFTVFFHILADLHG